MYRCRTGICRADEWGAVGYDLDRQTRLRYHRSHGPDRGGRQVPEDGGGYVESGRERRRSGSASSSPSTLLMHARLEAVFRLLHVVTNRMEKLGRDPSPEPRIVRRRDLSDRAAGEHDHRMEDGGCRFCGKTGLLRWGMGVSGRAPGRRCAGWRGDVC